LGVKGIDHPKTKIMFSFTHPCVVPSLYDFLSFQLVTLYLKGVHKTNTTPS